MTALTFSSAYAQLQEVEKTFVDSVLSQLAQQPVPIDVALLALERDATALQELSARSRGLIGRPLVRTAIGERVAQKAAENAITNERLMSELACIALSNPDNFWRLEPDGKGGMTRVFDASKPTEDQMRSVKAFKYSLTGDPLSGRGHKEEWTVTYHDKLSAIKMMGEVTGLFAPDNPFMRERAAQIRQVLGENATTQEAGDLYASQLGE